MPTKASMHSTNPNIPVESATVAINSLAQQKIATGIRVFNLSAGEPKLPTHPLVMTAAMQAMEQNKTFYPPVSGIPELKQAATQWLNQTYACSFKPEQCLITPGGKFGIYLLLQLLLAPGDEVLIPAPYWVSYPSLTTLFAGKARMIECDPKRGWKFTAAQLTATITKRSRILLLNSGCNPTGALYTKTELAQILKVAAEHDLWVISDEVYSGLIFDKNDYVSCGTFKQYRDRVLVIQSCSKSFAMTGWRVGFVFGPNDIIKALTILVGQSTSGVTTISQWAALAAIQNAKKITSQIKKTMQRRRDVLIKALNKAFKLKLTPPASTLYVFVSLKELGATHTSSKEFCEQALEKANVALVPGIAFGKEGFVRFSFGAAEEDLVSGVAALEYFVKGGSGARNK